MGYFGAERALGTLHFEPTRPPTWAPVRWPATPRLDTRQDHAVRTCKRAETPGKTGRRDGRRYAHATGGRIRALDQFLAVLMSWYPGCSPCSDWRGGGS